MKILKKVGIIVTNKHHGSINVLLDFTPREIGLKKFKSSEFELPRCYLESITKKLPKINSFGSLYCFLYQWKLSTCFKKKKQEKRSVTKITIATVLKKKLKQSKKVADYWSYIFFS